MRMQDPEVEGGNQEEGQQEARLQGCEAEGPEVEQVGQAEGSHACRRQRRGGRRARAHGKACCSLA